MTEDIKSIFQEVHGLTESLTEEIIATRRHFHQYPELSWHEVKTSEALASQLQDAGLECQNGICGTGVTAHLRGDSGGRTIAVRADMDALPINDAKDVPYASRIPGAMHACGHDCHMAVALGVAKVLNQLSLPLPGNVKFIFQPCEEASPSGASELVKAGVMEGVDAILAFHVDPELPVGKIGLRKGLLTAHCTEFRLKIRGKSGHAARPHQAVDAIYLANQVLMAIYDSVNQRSRPFVPAVLTVGKMIGGSKANVIADLVELGGTIRTIDDRSLAEITTDIERKVAALTSAAGGSYEIEYPVPVPSVKNDASLINMVADVTASLWSEDRIKHLDKVSMGGEDFSWYLKKAPGALMRLGTKKPAGEVTFLHSGNFDVDERALPLGVVLMSMYILKYLLAERLPL